MDYQKPLQVRAYESLKDMILEGHLENGQIYIIRGGVRYNLQGQIAE